MKLRTILRMIWAFHVVLAGVLVFAIYRSECIRESASDDSVFLAGFAEKFSALIGHGPDARWGGCWLEGVQTAVDTTNFLFECPGKENIEIEASLTERNIWRGCPYLLTTADSEEAFAMLSPRLCEVLPALPGSPTCCDRSRRESSPLTPTVSLGGKRPVGAN